jgi:hypothetical protein
MDRGRAERAHFMVRETEGPERIAPALSLGRGRTT